MWKDINLGKLTDTMQDFGLNYNPNFLRSVVNFTASGSTASTSAAPLLHPWDGAQVEEYQSDGGSNRSSSANVSL